MPRGVPTKLTVTIDDLAKLAGLSKDAVHQHVSRGYLDPTDLESILLWAARYASDDFRLRLLQAAIMREKHGGMRSATKRTATRAKRK